MAFGVDSITVGLFVCVAFLLYLGYLLNRILATQRQITRALFSINEALRFTTSRTSWPLPAFPEGDHATSPETTSQPVGVGHELPDPTESPMPSDSGSSELSPSTTTLEGESSETVVPLQASETSVVAFQDLDQEKARQIYSAWSAGEMTPTDPHIQILHLAYGGTRRPPQASELDPASDFWSEAESPREFVAVWQASAVTAFLFPHPSAVRDTYVTRFFGTEEEMSEGTSPTPLVIRRCADGKWELQQ